MKKLLIMAVATAFSSSVLANAQIPQQFVGCWDDTIYILNNGIGMADGASKADFVKVQNKNTVDVYSLSYDGKSYDVTRLTLSGKKLIIKDKWMSGTYKRTKCHKDMVSYYQNQLNY